jgi:aspartate kinase
MSGSLADEARANLVVMKFGGTSVEDAKAMLRTAAIVRGRCERGLKAAVVVSAMARVTDQLLAAAAATGRGDRDEALAISARLRTRHIETAADLLKGSLFAELKDAIEREFNALDDLLKGICAVGELTPRTSDNVVSFGERLSSRMVAAAFAQAGLNGVHVDARTCIPYWRLERFR